MVLSMSSIEDAEAISVSHSPENIQGADQQNTTAIDQLLRYIGSIPNGIIQGHSDQEIISHPETHNHTAEYNAFEYTGIITPIITGTFMPIFKVIETIDFTKGLGGANKATKAINNARGIIISLQLKEHLLLKTK